MRQVVTAAALVAACGLAFAQPPEKGKGRPGGGFPGGGMMGRMGGVAALAMNPSVQDELKLTDEQKTKLKDAADGIGAKMRARMEKFREMSEEERREALRNMAEEGRKMAEEGKKVVEGILQPEQMKRLKQIGWQQANVMAFADAEVQDGLKLTDEQKGKIKSIGEEARQDIEELMRSMRDNPQQGREKMKALQSEIMEKIQEELTADQRKSWKEMLGTPFEIKDAGFPGGRPGRERGKSKDKDPE